MIRIVSTGILAMLFAFEGVSYRFVCNGFLANGEERSDDCGVCDGEHAARWDNPHIPVVIDDDPLPAKISAKDWHDIIDKSFQAWTSVPGTSLEFVPLDGENPREFGANDDVHEIFWITDRMEWRKLVGSGEFGTLGATLPRYACSESEGSKRVISDADLVLNGLPHINWEVDCQNDDCISVQTTLVHELGHFFGLDHPCLMCSSSIMSARAGFDLVNPVFDDMEGLRVLYPDSEHVGGFGYPCTNDSDCAESHQCIFDGTNRFCTKPCVTDGDCEQGAICRETDGTKACTFIDGDHAGGRSVGENCMKAPCTEPLICAGASEPNFFCFQPCSHNGDCKAGEDCVKLEDDLSLCVGIRHRGESCTHRQLCEERLYCVFATENTGFCREPCKSTETADTGCALNERCELVENLVELCMPLEGNLVLDEHSDGFGQNGGPKAPNRAHKEPQKDDKAMGCSTLTCTSSSIFLWLFALSLLMIYRPHRKRAGLANIDR